MNEHNMKENAGSDTKKLPFTEVAYDPLNGRYFGAIHTPIYQTSLFAFENYDLFEQAMKDLQHHHVYSRGNNPTVEYLEGKLAELEGGETAKTFASGMAAITAAILSVVSQGDHVLCTHQVYGPTREFLGTYLQRFGIETTFIDGASLDNWEAEIRPNTKLMYLESPTSLLFELQDLRACTELARRVGAVTIIDNTWATPCHQQPLTLGVDLVVHSLSKFIGGHSDCIGGAVVGSKKLLDRISDMEYMFFGGVMTPQTAALVSRGLRTLPLRMRRHQESSLILAEYLQQQLFVTRVNHPGLDSHPQHELAGTQMSGYSSLFSFDTDAPVEQLKAWANELKYFKIGVSWGGFESLITVNRLQYGTGEDVRQVVRLYVGLEEPQDLIADINRAWLAVNG